MTGGSAPSHGPLTSRLGLTIAVLGEARAGVIEGAGGDAALWESRLTVTMSSPQSATGKVPRAPLFGDASGSRKVVSDAEHMPLALRSATAATAHTCSSGGPTARRND